MNREPLRDLSYWQEWIAECEDSIREIEGKLKTTPFPEKWRKNSMTKHLYDDIKRLMTLKYSGDSPISEIKKDYPLLIDAWVAYNQHIATGDNKKHLLMPYDYYRALTLISWGIIFKAPPSLFQKIADHIHSNGDDALIETLLAAQLPERRLTERIIFPKPFALLYKATQVSANEKADIIGLYLQDWYKNMKNYINYDAHKAKGEGGFAGYWSFEAAAVVVQYDIDDSGFKNMNYYPKDMVAFARQKS